MMVDLFNLNISAQLPLDKTIYLRYPLYLTNKRKGFDESTFGEIGEQNSQFWYKRFIGVKSCVNSVEIE